MGRSEGRETTSKSNAKPREDDKNDKQVAAKISTKCDRQTHCRLFMCLHQVHICPEDAPLDGGVTPEKRRAVIRDDSSR